MTSTIDRVVARQILDSKGRPTVEAEVWLRSGACGVAAVPSGTSTGRHEAHELRDHDPAQFAGLGVRQAVAHLHGEIADALRGMDATDQRQLDQTLRQLDGTPNLQRLGANAVLAASLACARAAANHLRQPLYRYLGQLVGKPPPSLPLPVCNLLSGGAHVESGLDFQDFLLLPLGAESFSQALHWLWSVRQHTVRLCRAEGLSLRAAGDGGLGVVMQDPAAALNLMVRAIEAAGLRPGEEVALGLDLAASDFRQGADYHWPALGQTFSPAAQLDYLAELAARFPLRSLEDVFDQDDWSGWQAITARLGHLQLVGDDLFATQPARVAQGVAAGAANAALLKLNQNGTLSGALDAWQALRAAGYATLIAARSGDTEDSFVADLAAGLGAGQVKFGPLQNSERLGKYNQLLRLEGEGDLPFAGATGLAGADAG